MKNIYIMYFTTLYRRTRKNRVSVMPLPCKYRCTHNEHVNNDINNNNATTYYFNKSISCTLYSSNIYVFTNHNDIITQCMEVTLSVFGNGNRGRSLHLYPGTCDRRRLRCGVEPRLWQWSQGRQAEEESSMHRPPRVQPRSPPTSCR